MKFSLCSNEAILSQFQDLQVLSQKRNLSDNVELVKKLKKAKHTVFVVVKLLLLHETLSNVCMATVCILTMVYDAANKIYLDKTILTTVAFKPICPLVCEHISNFKFKIPTSIWILLSRYRDSRSLNFATHDENR